MVCTLGDGDCRACDLTERIKLYLKSRVCLRQNTYSFSNMLISYRHCFLCVAGIDQYLQVFTGDWLPVLTFGDIGSESMNICDILFLVNTKQISTVVN